MPLISATRPKSRPNPISGFGYEISKLKPTPSGPNSQALALVFDISPPCELALF